MTMRTSRTTRRGGLVVALATGAVLALAGCTSGASDSADSSSTEMGVEDSAAADVGEVADGDRAALPSSDAVSQDREVVTSGWVSLVADDPAETVGEIATMAETAGGWVESRSQTARTDEIEPSATITIRLPADRVSDTVTALEGAGDVVDVSVDSVDVTATGQDLDARIRALSASVDRLTELIDTAESTSELIEAESELTTRQAELDSLSAQRDQLTEQVAMSTLTVSVSSAPGPTELAPGGFAGGVRAGWSALVSTVDVLIVAIGAALPWILPAALAYLLVRALRRRRAGGSAPGGTDANDPAAPGGGGPGTGHAGDHDDEPRPGRDESTSRSVQMSGTGR
ncbi:DUF4349 domain-containing protein [Paraoerskovia marina]|nr:DUF4349 domain-containing protein [Paraoerskovia marina]